MKTPQISALFSTFNRAALLREALASLEHQTLPPNLFEIIVIDDGSTDETALVAAEFGRKLPIRYAYQPNRGLAEGKNHAVKLANGPIIVFMDDDDIASPDLLEQHLLTHRKYPEENTAVLGFTDLRADVAASPLMHFVTQVGFYLFCYPKLKAGQILDYSYFWGGRSSCKRSLLTRWGMFNPVYKFGCEDIELGYRLSKRGLRVIYNEKARSTMIRSMSLDDFCRRVERQGRSSWIFSQQHPAPEIEALTEIKNMDKRWLSYGPLLDRFTKSAYGLERITKARLAHGMELDASLTSLLHRAYWMVIDGYRTKGAWEERNKEAVYDAASPTGYQFDT